MKKKNFWIEKTDNEKIRKIIFEDALTKGSHSFKNSKEAAEFPLVALLLQFPFVEEAFVTANFIALSKNDSVEWMDVEEDLEEVVEEQLKENSIFNKKENKSPAVQEAVEIYFEATPNPAVYKFLTNRKLVNSIVEVKNRDQDKISPLANYLFKNEYVNEVFLFQNYISITKSESEEWISIAAELRNQISHYLKNSNEIVFENAEIPSTQKEESEFSEIEIEIKNILDEYINPAVASDGGNIELIEYDEKNKTAKMMLQGACSGCPSSTATLKHGIESLLVEMLPDKINAVEAING